MNKEKLPLKIRIISGIALCLFLIVGLVLWDYFKEEPIRIWRYLIQGIIFGFIMSFVFRYKVTK